MKKIIKIIISLIIIISKALLMIPVHVTGGIRGVDEYKWISIIQYNYSNISCADCFNYEILWDRFFIELAITIIIVVLVNSLINKK